MPHFEGIHVPQVKTGSVVCDFEAFKSVDLKETGHLSTVKY